VVADIMQRKVLTADPSMSVDEAARLLSQQKINALPVVERGRIVGIITTSDVLAAFVDLSGVAEPSYRVSLVTSGRRGEREVRRVLEPHRCELKWLHTEPKATTTCVNLRLKTQKIDDITTALEAAGFTVAAVVTSRPGAARVHGRGKVTEKKRKAS
jgi:acetoin utilization protein AcuB